MFDSGFLPDTTLNQVLLDLPHRNEPAQLELTIVNGATSTLRTYPIRFANSKPTFTPLTATIQDGTLGLAWTPDLDTVTSWDLLVTQSGSTIYEIQDAAPTLLSTTLTGAITDGSTVTATLTPTGSNYATPIVRNYGTISTPKLVSPNGLSSDTATFIWSPEGFVVDSWRLTVGLSLDSTEFSDNDLIDGAILSKTVTGLPTDGVLIYISLYYTQNGQSEAILRYVKNAFFDPPGFTSPNISQNMPSTNLSYSWSNGSATIASFRLTLGSQSGFTDFYDSGTITSSFNSYVLPSVPVSTENIFATLYYTIQGQPEVRFISRSNVVQKQPSLSINVSGVFDSNVDITWDAEEVPVVSYDLFLIYDDDQSSILGLTNLPPSTVSHSIVLPANGRVIKATLAYNDGSSVRSVEQLDANSAAINPTITNPFGSLTTGIEDRFKIPTLNLTITWDPGNIAASVINWQILVGSTEAGSEYETSALLPSIDRSYNISSYPLDGSPIYVTLVWFL